jgi:GTP-binding protein
VLLHLVDAHGEDPVGAWQTVRDELASYGAGLEDKTEVIALNKTDLLDAELTEALSAELHAASGADILPLSGATGSGLEAVLDRLVADLGPAPEVWQAEQAPAEEDESWSPL